jgi:hypothetical protein
MDVFTWNNADCTPSNSEKEKTARYREPLARKLQNACALALFQARGL